jgi:hypothetical protein
MIHAPEDVMCYAVQGTKPLWKNTNVTVRDIRTVFKHSPCLICVLAKKRKEGMAQWKPRKKYKKLRIGKELSDTKDWKPSTTTEMNQQDESDAKRYKPGGLLSCDNVGPVNPKSFEGYVQSFIWRDTSTKRMFRGRVPGRTRDHPYVLQETRDQDQGHQIRRLHYIQV